MKKKRPTLAQLKQAGRDALWRLGNLSYKFDEGRPTGAQRAIYDASKYCASETFVTEASRRLGKSFVHAIIAVELAIKFPGSRINWAQATSKNVRDTAVPLFKLVCADAPESCKGTFNDARSKFEFPNGSYIFIFGCDTADDAHRGGRGGDNPIANFVDEAREVDLLELLYTQVIGPSMFRITRREHYGMTFILSSTPDRADHYFRKVANTSSASGGYIKLDIYNDPRAESKIKSEAAKLGYTVEEYKATDSFKREFLCETVYGTESFVFPAMNKFKEKVVVEHPRPPGFDAYIYRRVSIDPGRVQDPTGMLFGYVDYLQQKVVIEDEALLTHPSAIDVANKILSTEKTLWPNANPKRITRVIDDSQSWLRSSISGLVATSMAIKDHRDASIALINRYIIEGKLVISPKCKQLQVQLLNAQYDKREKDFLRDEDGHSDLCAALMYFIRGINFSDPYPERFDTASGIVLSEWDPRIVQRLDRDASRPKGIMRAFDFD